MPEAMTPEAALSDIAAEAVKWGYQQGAMWRDCPVLTTNGRDHVENLDLAVFASPYVRGVPEHCCLGISVVKGRSIDPSLNLLRDSGAGVQIALGGDQWHWRPDSGAELDGPHPLAALHGTLNDRRHFLAPAQVMARKRCSQGYLFERIFPITHGKLVGTFEDACRAGYRQIPTAERSKAECLHRLCALALRILCMHVLCDRGLAQHSSLGLANGRQSRPETWDEMLGLVRALPTHLRGIRAYLSDGDFGALGWDVAVAVFEVLKGESEHDYSSVTPDMLGPFYQRALMRHPRTGKLDKQRQKAHGVFYTSRRIAQTILDRLPVEEIPPADRYVLDPTCGSGSFLIAAEQRLLELARPRRTPGHERASDVSALIQGNDSDRFAVEVAKLALALDRPEVEPRYRFKTVEISTGGRGQQTRPYSRRPNIIVGNPPFLRHGKTRERAAEFMKLFADSYLRDGGLLGLIMPATFLTGRDECRRVREFLLSSCEVLELWDLPRNALVDPAFRVASNGDSSSGGIGTCAILLKKKASSGHGCLTRVFQVHGRESRLEAFRDSGAPTAHSAARIAEVSSAFGENRWPVAPFAETLRRLHESEACYPLAGVCQVRNGIQRAPEKPVDEKRGSKYVPWLQDSEGLRPFTMLTAESGIGQHIKYPGKARRSKEAWARRDSVTGAQLADPEWRERGIFAGRKIMVKSNMDPGSPRCVHAFLDAGHYPSDSFHFVWLDPGLRLSSEWEYETLLAFLNGPIAQAWMGTARTVNNPIDLLRQVPLPAVTRRELASIRRRVATILACDDKGKRERNIADLEEAVLQLYPLSDLERALLRAWLNEYEEEPRWDLAWTEEPWTIHGIVESVDRVNDDASPRVSICIPGFRSSAQTYCGRVPADMPGWAIVPGCEFQAEIPWSDAESSIFAPDKVRRFRPLPFAHRRQSDSPAKE